MNDPLAVSDLFSITRYLQPKDGKPMNERAGLLKYFLDNAEDRSGNKLEPARMGKMLSHLTLTDLYYFKSSLEQRRDVSWNKAFWGSLKIK